VILEKRLNPWLRQGEPRILAVLNGNRCSLIDFNIQRYKGASLKRTATEKPGDNLSIKIMTVTEIMTQ
jgi:hypothetical protein